MQKQTFRAPWVAAAVVLACAVAADAQTGTNVAQSQGGQQGVAQQHGTGPLQGAGPLQGGGLLQNAGPLQGAGPLHGAGPLQSAAPLQNAAPAGPGSLEDLQPQSAGDPLLMPVPTAPPTAASFTPVVALPTDVGTLNQLVAQLLAGPNGTSPAVLAGIVNGFTGSPGSPPPAAPATLPPPAIAAPVFTPTSAQLPPTAPTPSAPVPLPPVFNVPPQAQASPR